jgi:hypothetical protein
MSRLILLILFTQFLYLPVFAQNISGAWDTFYEEPFNESCNIKSIKATSDGGFICAASSLTWEGWNIGGGAYMKESITVLKYDKCGNVRWRKILFRATSFSSYYVPSIIETSTGNYLLSGILKCTPNQADDILLCMLDSNGTILWNGCYGGGSYESEAQVVESIDHNFIIAGSSRSTGGDLDSNQGVFDIWLFKIDPSGNIIWSKSYGGNGTDRANDLIQTSDGGYLIGGYTVSSSEEVPAPLGESDFWILKTDSEGNEEWQKRFGGSDHEQCTAVVETNNGEFIATGRTRSLDIDVSTSFGSFDFWTIKLDAEGNLIWEQSHGGSYNDQPNAIGVTPSGNILIAGHTGSNDGGVTFSNGDIDAWIVVLSDDGEFLWEKTFGSDGADSIEDIHVIDDSTFLFCGRYNADEGNSDSSFVGGIAWIKLLTSTDNREFDGCAQISYEYTDGVFPNPTNDFIYIKEFLPENSKYFVTNAAGQIVQEGILPGSYAQLDFTSLQSGLYLLKIEGYPAQKILKRNN